MTAVLKSETASVCESDCELYLLSNNKEKWDYFSHHSRDIYNNLPSLPVLSRE